MDATPGFVLWRVRRSPHFVSCVVEQVGEECFELHIFDGHELIIRESFDATGPLLGRSETLRLQFSKEFGTKPEAATRELVRS